MLTKEELLNAARQRAASQAEMARVLGLDPARVNEMFKGKRNLSYDEAVKLVAFYKLEEQEPSVPQRLLAPILQALIPLAPHDERISDQAAKALAEAALYAVELLKSADADHPTDREIAVASQAMLREFQRSWQR